jgi:hypothetical protein
MIYTKFLLANASKIIGVALQFVAASKGLLLAGKMVNGFAIGGLLAVGTTYGSEVYIGLSDDKREAHKLADSSSSPSRCAISNYGLF